MLTQLQKFPGPYPGGKRHAAPTLWAAVGDVCHYMAPFCGTCADLLERPHPYNRPYHSETVNDADGLLVNALRSLQLYPQETAEAASGFVSEADLHAKHLALLAFVTTQPLEQLMGDPHWCDPEIGGWWLWGLSLWIGSGWCSGVGPWRVDPATGRITKDGRPGVKRKRPGIGHSGRGVLRPGTREPGVWRQLPHLADNGRGVQRPGTREPGVTRQLPHLADNGRGVLHAGTREPGVMPIASAAVQALQGWQAQVEADYAATDGFHPMTMPELRRWFAYLSARLRHVRILNGDWQRCVTTGALKILQVRQGQGHVGIFLDPPYALSERDKGLYRVDATATRDLAGECRAWCVAHGDDPDYRIVLAGYAGEGHEVLEAHGWRCVSWFEDGHLRGGMGTQAHRDRLWLSPHTLGPEAPAPQLGLFTPQEEERYAP